MLKQPLVYTNIYAILKRKGTSKMNDRPGRKRLSVDMPIQLHEAIKFSAQVRGITITKWILRAAFARIKQEKILKDED